MKRKSTKDMENTIFGPPNRRKCNDTYFGSLNVRSISNQDRVEAFDKLAVASGCKVIALQETKRQNGSVKTPSGGEIITFDRKPREGGVGFWICKEWSQFVVECVKAKERLAILQLELNRFKLNFVNGYAPTTAASESTADNFYRELRKTYNTTKRWDSTTLVIGDFNAQIGPTNNEDGPYIGRHGTGARNFDRDRLYNFALSNRIFLVNSLFPKRSKKNGRGPARTDCTNTKLTFC